MLGEKKIKKVATLAYRNQHANIHGWIRKNYGSAIKCESNLCTKEPHFRFEWALRHGKAHSKKIENYIQLCNKCHRKYDLNSPIPKIEIAGHIISGDVEKKLTKRKHIGINITVSKEFHQKMLLGAFNSKPRKTLRQYINKINNLSENL